MSTTKNSVGFLQYALGESVKLQSHYAKLLNMHDGGERMSFADADEWLVRLAKLNADGEFPDLTAPESVNPAAPGASPKANKFAQADRISDAIVDLLNAEIAQRDSQPLQLLMGVLLGLMGLLEIAPPFGPVDELRGMASTFLAEIKRAYAVSPAQQTDGEALPAHPGPQKRN